MHIRFAKADEAFIKASVEQGLYTSETELVRDAVRRMREKPFPMTERFRKAVMDGVESAEKYGTVELTPELMKELREEGIRRAKNNEPYHSYDAIPIDED